MISGAGQLSGGTSGMRTLILAMVVAAVVAAGCQQSGGEVAGPDQRVTVELGDAPTVGPADAAVVVVEFGDFQCPYCGEMEPVVQRLLTDYDGRLRFAFKQFPISYHSHAQLAAEASLAANAQGAFWPYHDALYAHQDALTRADLEGYAADLGLDLDLFRAALDDGTYTAAVTADLEQGLAIGVNGTPAFFINGRAAFGAMSYGTISDVVDEELKLAGQ
jgi:protein-disulfide isomerase